MYCIVIVFIFSLNQECKKFMILTQLQDNQKGKENIPLEATDNLFRPKAMSSPDFLKRYRNDEDWPEFGEDDEEEGIQNYF